MGELSMGNIESGTVPWIIDYIIGLRRIGLSARKIGLHFIKYRVSDLNFILAIEWCANPVGWRLSGCCQTE